MSRIWSALRFSRLGQIHSAEVAPVRRAPLKSAPAKWAPSRSAACEIGAPERGLFEAAGAQIGARSAARR